MDCLRAAHWYAARGWPVFPCRPAAKAPCTARGFKDATTDPQLLTYWWRRWIPARWPGEGDPNVAIVTGTLSGLVVVDIDSKHDDGFASWSDLMVELGVPHHTTFEVATASGGLHLYYRHPGVEVRNRAGLVPGVDVRGDGGYVLAAPSFIVYLDEDSPVPFGRYEISDPDVEPVDMPAGLVALLTAPSVERPDPASTDPLERVEAALRLPPPGDRREAYVRAAVEGEVQRLLDAVNGTRNDTLFKAAARLSELSLSADAVADALTPAAQRVGLDAAEIASTIRSGVRHGSSNQRTVPDG